MMPTGATALSIRYPYFGMPDWSWVFGKAIKNLRPILAGTARESFFQKHYNGADIGINNLTAAHCRK